MSLVTWKNNFFILLENVERLSFDAEKVVNNDEHKKEGERNSVVTYGKQWSNCKESCRRRHHSHRLLSFKKKVVIVVNDAANMFLTRFLSLLFFYIGTSSFESWIYIFIQREKNRRGSNKRVESVKKHVNLLVIGISVRFGYFLYHTDKFACSFVKLKKNQEKDDLTK